MGRSRAVKSNVVGIRLSDKEKADLEAAAQELGQTLSSWVRTTLRRAAKAAKEAAPPARPKETDPVPPS